MLPDLVSWPPLLAVLVPEWSHWSLRIGPQAARAGLRLLLTAAVNRPNLYVKEMNLIIHVPAVLALSHVDGLNESTLLTS